MVYGVDYVGTFVGCVPRIRRQRLKMPLSAIAYVVSQRMVKGDIWEGLPHILIIIIDFKVWAFRLLYHSNPCVTQINGLNGADRLSAESGSAPAATPHFESPGADTVSLLTMTSDTRPTPRLHRSISCFRVLRIVTTQRRKTATKKTYRTQRMSPVTIHSTNPHTPCENDPSWAIFDSHHP